jgi:hypothetical protein
MTCFGVKTILYVRECNSNTTKCRVIILRYVKRNGNYFFPCTAYFLFGGVCHNNFSNLSATYKIIVCVIFIFRK